ncbi:RNA polymerase sigma factor [Brevibacillus thermoruber]|uniref:RNA polymerase sigma factor n=1 Tax=Brevibacillus thermoruber TaxID=33942 RepID=UPI001E47A3D3|nr:sigma-70 family RNA polymerase sigma factor [Brevibacillus thermoruber]
MTESKGQFVNWLLTITRNITVDHLRWKSEIRLSCPSNRSVGSTSPIIRPATRLTVVSRKLLREEMEKAYRYLSPSQVELIRSLYWEGYSFSEIACMRNEPIGSIKSRLHQALKVLRNHLVPEMEG